MQLGRETKFFDIHYPLLFPIRQSIKTVRIKKLTYFLRREKIKEILVKSSFQLPRILPCFHSPITGIHPIRYQMVLPPLVSFFVLPSSLMQWVDFLTAASLFLMGWRRQANLAQGRVVYFRIYRAPLRGGRALGYMNSLSTARESLDSWGENYAINV